MSLTVSAYKRDPMTGDIADLLVAPTSPRNDLAGFETWRQQVYGSSIAQTLGLTLLASLARNEDVYADGADLDRLKSETDALLENVRAIAPGGHDRRGDPLTSAFVLRAGVQLPDAEDLESTIRFRLENILEAVRLAKNVTDGGGGVYIG